MENKHFKKLVTIELEEYQDLLDLNSRILNGEVFYTVTMNFSPKRDDLVKKYISSDEAVKGLNLEILSITDQNKNLADENHKLKENIIKLTDENTNMKENIIELTNENTNMKEKLSKMERKLHLIDLMNMSNRKEIEKTSNQKKKLSLFRRFLEI